MPLMPLILHTHTHTHTHTHAHTHTHTHTGAMDIMKATQCNAHAFNAAFPEFSKWRSCRFPVLFSVVRPFL